MSSSTVCHSLLSIVMVFSADNGPASNRIVFVLSTGSIPDPKPRFSVMPLPPSSAPVKFTCRFCASVTVATTGTGSPVGNLSGINISSRVVFPTLVLRFWPEATGGSGVHGGSAHSAWPRADWMTNRIRRICFAAWPIGCCTERSS